jgi:hypothetical protein
MSRFSGLLILIAVCFTTGTAGSGGSAYSIFGIGDIRYMSGMRNAGMGGAGLGLSSASSISTISPAAWSRIDRVRLEAGVLYEGFHSSDGHTSIYRAAGTFQGSLLAIPISPRDGIVFAGGFVPYSAVNYNTFDSGRLEGIDYLLNYKGTGGLGRGFAGLSYAPLPWLSMGTAVAYYFGSAEKSFTLFASEATGRGVSGGTTTDVITAHGTGVIASVLIESFGQISEALRPLSLGLTAGSRTWLKTASQTRYKFTSETDSTAEVPGTLVLPLSFGAGVGYQVTDRFSVAADIFAQLWEEAEVNGAPPADIRDATRIAVGGELAGSREPAARWFERISYRLGSSYTATYYSPDGNPVNEWGVTGGASIPFAGDALLNLGVEYAHRSVPDQSLITDNIIRVLLSINIGEGWFNRPDDE